MSFFIWFWFASVLRKRCWLHEKSFTLYHTKKREEGEKIINMQLKIDSQPFLWSAQ